jgi:hypothetical protein
VEYGCDLGLAAEQTQPRFGQIADSVSVAGADHRVRRDDVSTFANILRLHRAMAYGHSEPPELMEEFGGSSRAIHFS